MKLFAPLIAASVLALGFAAAPVYAADTYTLDPNHTLVAFEYNHGGFSHMNGKFMNAVGTVTLDDAAPANSSVEVSFAIAGINTGVPALDTHLKSPDFFDADKFPTATFKSTSVAVTGASTADVTGDLTIHGVTKPVTLHVTLNKRADDKSKAGFSATGSIQRSAFGIDKWVSPDTDTIALTIESEAKK